MIQYILQMVDIRDCRAQSWEPLSGEMEIRDAQKSCTENGILAELRRVIVVYQTDKKQGGRNSEQREQPPEKHKDMGDKSISFG